MLDTIKQLFNLIWFCKKVSFLLRCMLSRMSGRNLRFYETGETVKPVIPCSFESENLLAVHEQFSLMNLLTSKVNGKQLEHQMINIWRCCKILVILRILLFCSHSSGSLSGTPLNEHLCVFIRFFLSSRRRTNCRRFSVLF